MSELKKSNFHKRTSLKVHSQQFRPAARSSYFLVLVTAKRDTDWSRPAAKKTNQTNIWSFMIQCRTSWETFQSAFALPDGSVSGNLSTSSSCSETYTSYSDIKP